jgi:hypothetical protein
MRFHASWSVLLWARGEENYAAVAAIYRALGDGDRVRYLGYAGDHDFTLEVRWAAMAWGRGGCAEA